MAGIRIQERMAGWIRFDKIPGHDFKIKNVETGTQYPFEININCYCNELGYPFPFNFKGDAYFPGIPLPPTSPESDSRPDIEGTMGISHKGVSYDFDFELPELGKFHCEGAKQYKYTLHWPTYRRSLIWLPLTIRQNGEVVGEAEMMYLNPLYEFPFGVSPCTDETAYNPRVKLAKRLMTLAPTLVPDFDQVSYPGHTWEQIQMEVDDLPFTSYWYCRFAVVLLTLISYIRFFKGLRKLNEKERDTFADYLENIRWLNLLVVPPANVVFSAVYSSKKYLEMKGQNIPVKPKNVEDEPWMQLNQTPTVQMSEEEIEVDVVVVGSGAGGGAFAYEMARKGHAVAIVEQGHYFKRPDFNGNRNSMMSKLYTGKGHSFALSNSPVWIPTGKCVGGTTTINSGTVIETPPDIINGWEKNLGLKNLGLEKYFPEVKQMLDAKPTPDEIVGGISEVLKKGLNTENGLKVESLTRAETGCDGQSYCILGCPIDAKRSTNVSYVKEAMRNNAFLFSRYRVDQILMEGEKAVGVKASLEDYGPEFSLTIKAKLVVIAAGTFGTPAILHKSGIAKNLPQFGKNLSIHPALNLGGMFDYKVREKFFVPQSLGVFGHEHGDYVLEGYTIPTDTIPTAFINYGKELKHLMDNVDYFSNFAAMIKDPCHGKLLFTRKKVIPTYYFTKQLRGILKHATLTLGNIFFDAGAKAIYTPISGYQKLTDRQQLERLVKKHIFPYSYNLSAHHPLGTCRMGSNSENSVVNSNCEVWGTKNLFVTDGSVIPGPLGVNPQVTIMSNALRVANIVEERLQ